MNRRRGEPDAHAAPRPRGSLGLVVREDDAYADAPASGRYLVRGDGEQLGEFFRLQIGRQIHSALAHLDAGVAGTSGAFDSFADPSVEVLIPEITKVIVSRKAGP